jgi:TolB protein
MKNWIAVSLILIVGNFTALAKKIDGDVSPIFDISPDEKSLVVSISKGQESFLYLYSFDKQELEQLTNKKGAYHSRPMFSTDGNKVVFLNKELDKQKSQVTILDMKTRDIKEIETSVSFVTEAVFHPNDNQILFCASSFIGNYSPMARKAPHDIDMYSINIDGTNESKITDYSAYALSSISIDNKGEQIAFKVIKKDKLEGIYIMSLSDTSKIQKIEANNNPRPQIGNDFYGTPYFSKNNSTISFIAPYQVYTLNLSSKECKIVWDNTKDDVLMMAIHSRFMNSDKKIIISGLKIINRQYTSNATIMIVNLENGKTEELKLK